MSDTDIPPWRRQPSQAADKSLSPPAPPSNSTYTVPVTNNAGATPPPSAAPAPPPPPPHPSSGAPAAPHPPPPPTLNGGMIPTIRLKSEIPERAEPPAKLQGAMMKDKKPFTYTPGGIDLSEIKSPRMAKRVKRNAQEPEDIVLPPSTSTPVSTASLPPSAIAAMCPQIAIPVFPQNNMADRKPLNSHRNGHIIQNVPPPPPPRQPSPASSPTPPSKPVSTVSTTPKAETTQQGGGANTAEHKPKAVTLTPINNANRTQVGSIYVPPVSETDSGKSKPSSPPTFPTLREAPTPWLNKHQQQQQPDNVPAWRTRHSQNKVTKETEQDSKPGPTQLKVNTEAESNKAANDGRVIQIQIEGAAPKINHSKRWGTAKDNNETVQSTINNRATEPEPKPIQSRSFKVLQKITGSEDDSTDAPYNSEGVPLSQLRKLKLNEDDRAFMNKVKSQVDEDTFLHMETDPRYRGSVIPSRAFRMLQNMTDSGQVTSNNVVVIPVNHTSNTNTNHNQPKQSHPMKNTVEVHVAPPSQPAATQQEIETKRNYIPPSERQAEQDLRKYMGSSIPSRSFRMLQAMTATQDSTVRAGETDF